MTTDPSAQLRHELRTPLNHIIGYTELVLEELPGADTAGLNGGLTTLRADARHLLGLLNEVLAGEAGSRDLPAACASLRPPLERVRTTLSMLQQNPNLIVAGRSYNIPTATTAAPAPVPTAPVAPTPAPVVSNDTPVTPAAPTGHFYTVQPGDSLTKIAVVQLGSAGAVNAIKDLNKETLKGGDTIRPNMKLRLPSKPIAS